MGKRAEQKKERKRNLLRVSLSLFVKKGFDGTTVRDIASEARISPGLLFHYFPTKDDILRELLIEAQAGFGEMIDLLESESDPLEGFQKVAHRVLLSFTNSSTINTFLLVNQVKTYALLSDNNMVILNTVGMMERSISIIKRGQVSNQFKKDNPEALALGFWGALQGIAELLSWHPEYPIPSVQSVVDILRAHDRS